GHLIGRHPRLADASSGYDAPSLRRHSRASRSSIFPLTQHQPLLDCGWASTPAPLNRVSSWPLPALCLTTRLAEEKRSLLARPARTCGVKVRLRRHSCPGWRAELAQSGLNLKSPGSTPARVISPICSAASPSFRRQTVSVLPAVTFPKSSFLGVIVSFGGRTFLIARPLISIRCGLSAALLSISSVERWAPTAPGA